MRPGPDCRRPPRDRRARRARRSACGIMLTCSRGCFDRARLGRARRRANVGAGGANACVDGSMTLSEAPSGLAAPIAESAAAGALATLATAGASARRRGRRARLGRPRRRRSNRVARAAPGATAVREPCLRRSFDRATAGWPRGRVRRAPRRGDPRRRIAFRPDGRPRRRACRRERRDKASPRRPIRGRSRRSRSATIAPTDAARTCGCFRRCAREKKYCDRGDFGGGRETRNDMRPHAPDPEHCGATQGAITPH